MAIAIPGEIAGYWKAHKQYGRLPWSALFRPAIDMCNDGITVQRALAFSILKNKARLYEDAAMRYCSEGVSRATRRHLTAFRRVFFKGDSDRVYGQGDTIYRPRLGETLSTIAEKGPSAFYNGELSDGICDEIQANGGIINRTDLETYHARVKPAISIELDKQFTAYGVPPPASSAITLLILKVMDGQPLLFYMLLIFSFSLLRLRSHSAIARHRRETGAILSHSQRSSQICLRKTIGAR